MQITSGVLHYEITWKHFRGAEASAPLFDFLNPELIPTLHTRDKSPKDLISDITVCEIRNLNGWSGTKGYAFCSVKDIFDKETGRRESLKRALKTFSKDFRTRVWKAYFNRKHHDQKELKIKTKLCEYLESLTSVYSCKWFTNILRKTLFSENTQINWQEVLDTMKVELPDKKKELDEIG